MATASGNFHALDHTRSQLLWPHSDGAPTADLYKTGVTVAERGTMAPVAVLPIAHSGPASWSPNSGIVRAIHLQTRLTEWQVVPSMTLPGSHTIDGSVAVLFEQRVPETTPGGSGTAGGDSGSSTDVVKVGIHGQNGLIVGAGLRAYRLRQVRASDDTLASAVVALYAGSRSSVSIL